MPLYDIPCQHCQGIFEKRVSLSALHEAVTCPYCQESTPASPLISGRNLSFQIKETWRPQSSAEQLAGPGIQGEGTQSHGKRNSVLHTCRGMNCSICGT